VVSYTSDLVYYHSLTPSEKLSVRLEIPVLALSTVIENHEPLIDLRVLDTEKSLLFHKSIPNTLIRAGFAQKILSIAQRAKAQGYLLEIYELYRSIRKQAREFFDIEHAFRVLHPEASEDEIYSKTTQYIADPFMIPPHCTGGAIDVILRDIQTLEAIDMGAPINTAHEISHIIYEDLTCTQKANRQILLQLFLEVGCAPLPTEWWHFSFGERYWAAFYQTQAQYGMIQP